MLRKLSIGAAFLALALPPTSLAQSTHKASNYESAKKVVNVIFPSSTQSIMLRVLGCETGGKYNADAHNASGASGYFQILSSHNGSTFSYNGVSVTVDRNRLFDPVYNTLVAYVMSNGGTSLSPWYSSRGCWG